MVILLTMLPHCILSRASGAMSMYSQRSLLMTPTQVLLGLPLRICPSTYGADTLAVHILLRLTSPNHHRCLLEMAAPRSKISSFWISSAVETLSLLFTPHIKHLIIDCSISLESVEDHLLKGPALTGIHSRT